jgi:hypothetical protein
MATITGVSVKGLQLLGTSDSTNTGRCSIRFNGNMNPDRLERVGTLLITNSNDTPAQHRTLAVFKLYGHGILTPEQPLVVKFTIPVQFWVNWFRPSLAWRLDTA